MAGATEMIASEPVNPPTKTTGEPVKTDEKDVIINKKHSTIPKKDRDLWADVSAYVNLQTRTLEVYLYDTGETNIYIVDSQNEVVSEGLYLSDCFPIARVTLPELPGRYWVVIDSESIYAEGVFVK